MRTAVRGFGEVLITLGVLVILFAVYELYGTGIATAHAQHDLTSQLRQEWARPSPGPSRSDGGGGKTDARSGGSGGAGASHTPGPGSSGSSTALGIHGIAILHIPRLGPGWTPRVIVEGVTPADLREGPGHYPDSAAAGQVGNFAVAGHRATHGNGFFYLDKLRPGDPIIVETRTSWFTYDMTGSERVVPSATQVVAPVPDHPGATPTKAMITLTTCDPWWDSSHRLVIYGTLTNTRPTSQGPPPGVTH